MKRTTTPRLPRLGKSLRLPLAALLSAALVIPAAGSNPPPGFAAHLLVTINQACDLLIVPEGDAAEPGMIGVAEHSTVRLGDDGDATPLVYECDPTFDGTTGELLTGNGITVEVDNVTLDLNGHSIHSISNVAAAGEEAGLDVENAGVSVGGNGVKVTNSSNTVSTVDNFTANFDLKCEDCILTGMLIGGTSYNLVGGNAHGGGALAIDKSKRLTVDTVKLVDLSADGDNGIDLKRSEGVIIKASHIEGSLTGVRVRDTKAGDFGLKLLNNFISGHAGTGIEIGGRVEGNSASNPAVISGNTITDNAFNGVSVGAETKFISITANTITDYGDCGIEVSPAAQNIVVSPNTIDASGAGGTVC